MTLVRKLRDRLATQVVPPVVVYGLAHDAEETWVLGVDGFERGASETQIAL